MAGKFDIQKLRDVPPESEAQLKSEIPLHEEEDVSKAIFDLYHSVDHNETKTYSYVEAHDANGKRADVIQTPPNDSIAKKLAAVALAAKSHLRPGDVQYDKNDEALITPSLLAAGLARITLRAREGKDFPHFFVGQQTDFQKQFVKLTFSKMKP